MLDLPHLESLRWFSFPQLSERSAIGLTRPAVAVWRQEKTRFACCRPLLTCYVYRPRREACALFPCMNDCLVALVPCHRNWADFWSRGSSQLSVDVAGRLDYARPLYATLSIKECVEYFAQLKPLSRNVTYTFRPSYGAFSWRSPSRKVLPNANLGDLSVFACHAFQQGITRSTHRYLTNAAPLRYDQG